MPYEVEAFGKIIEVPDDVSHADAYKQIMANKHKLGYDEFTDPENFKTPNPEALDYAKGFAAGANKLVSGVGYLAEAAGAKETGKAIREFGDRGAAYWNSKLSPGGKKAAESQVFVDDPESITGLRLGDDAGKALLMGASQSLPSMFAAALPGVAITKGIQALASLGLAGGAGATIPLLAGTAAPVGTAANVIARVPSAIGFGAAEGIVSGAMNAAEFKSSIEGMSDKELSKSPVYLALKAEHGEEKAKQLIADQAASDIFGRTALSTGAIGAVTGGGALGQAYQKATTGAADGIVGSFLKGGRQEFIQETPQSAGEKYIENLATKKYLNPDLDTMSGVSASAASGGATGAFTGGIFGAGSAVNITTSAQQKADRINAERVKLGLDKIVKATTVDEAINAANESVSQKPVDKDDVLRVADPTLADIERLTGLKPSETLQTAQEELQRQSQAAQQNIATGSDIEIVLPDNKTLNAQWDIVDADNVKASLKNGEIQPRDRARAASDLQIQSIAKNPDYRRLSDSPVMDIGAPVLSNDGQIVGGNGRFEAISRAYDQDTAQEYIDNLRQDAIRKGIDPAVIDQMKKPVLVRRITQPFDTRQLAIASNSGMSAQYSDLEQAKIDSERLKGLEDILTTDNGDIALTADNIRRVRDALGNYSAAEIAPFVDANGQLSQQGMKRIRNAMLAKAYGDNQVIQGLIESNDSDIRNILGALTRVVGDAVKSQSTAPKESDVTPSILEAINIYNQLKQKNQPVSNYLKQQDAFSGNVSPAVENVLMFLDKNARSQPKLTEFFRDAYTKLGSIDTKTADIFGQEIKPKPEDLFAKPTIESQLEKHLKKNGYEFDVNPVTEREFNSLDESKKAQKELAEKQAKIFGKKVVFVKTKGKFGINGVMVPAIKDTIFIDLNTPKPFHAVMAHELSHWMEQENPKAYKDMLAALKNIIVNEDGYRRKYNIDDQTEGLIPREIAGDLMGDNFTKPEFWQKVAEYNPSKFKEIAQNIIKWLKNIILKAKARGMGSEEWVTDAKKAQDIIANAVSQYTKEQDAVGEKIEFKKKSEGDLKLSKDKQEDGIKISSPSILNNLSQKEFERLIQELDNPYLRSDDFSRGELKKVIKSLESKGIKYIDFYHVTDQDYDQFIGSKSINARNSSLSGRDGFVERDAAVYGFLDPDDITKGYRGILGSNKDRPNIVRALIPIDDLYNLEWDSNFNVTFGTYSAVGFYGDIPIKLVSEVYNEVDLRTLKANSLDNINFSKQEKLPDTINIDGIERPTRNSEGRLIHSTEEGIRNFWKWFSPSPSLIANELSISEINSLKRNVKSLGDFIESQSGVPESESFRVIPSSVFNHMSSAVNNDKILDAVIRSIPVDVMNFLGGSKSSAKKILHDPSVLKNMLTINSGSDVTLGVDPSVAINILMRVITNTGAKITGLTGRSIESNSAVLANTGDPILGTHIKNSPYKDMSIIPGFGGSKVVDDQGRPLVVYHGTDIDFNEFDRKKINSRFEYSFGFHFTDSKNEASIYADSVNNAAVEFNPKSKFSKDVKIGGNVIPVYIKSENPLIINTEFSSASMESDFNRFDIINKIIESRKTNNPYDGVVIENKKGNEFDNENYIVFEPNQIKSAIGNNGEFSESNNDIRFSQQKPFNPNEDIPETKAQKAQRIGQDKFNRFRVIKEWLAKEKGINLSEAADVYGAEERYYGKVANQQEDFREKVRNPLIEKISKAGYKLDDIEQYLLNRHAQEANAQNRKLTGKEDSTAYGISDADAQAYLDKAPKELAKLADEVQALTNKAQQLRLDNGIENQERIDAMNGAYKYYVPVRGDAESQQKQNQYKGTGKGFSMKYKPKRRLGHELRNESVIENIFQDYERAIIQVEDNRMGKSLALMAAEIQMPELISIDQPVKRKILRTDTAFTVEHDGEIRGVFHTMPEAQMFKKVLEGGLFEGKPSSNIKINKTQDQRLIYSASPMLADNEVLVYMNGHEIRLQINDELLARAYKNMGTEALGNILSTGRAINGWMSKAYTGYNPYYILVNLLRDFQTGFANLTGEQGILIAAKAVANYPKSFASLLKYAFNGKSDKWIDAYRDNGGNTGAAYLPDLERLGEEVKREYASYQGVIANLKEGDSANALRAAGRKAFNATLKYINHLNAASENAFRVATFKAMVESGKSVNEAASMAKNVTVNFNRKGELGSELSALYLFFNPSIQGTAATSHALFKGRHKYQAWGLVGSMMTIGYMMASMLGGFDDEDKYDEISDATKSRNLIMAYGDGYLKIPIPYGYGFFYNAGRMFAEAQRKGELGKMPYQLMALAIEEFSPFNVATTEDSEFSSKKVFYGFLPTMLKIPAEITNNFSSFTNRELYPEKEWYKSEPDNEKMWRGTKGSVYDISAQYLASIGIEISPEVLKYMNRTATGGSGAFVDQVVSGAMLKSQGAELEAREIPFVNKFYGENTIQDARARYGKAKEEARIAFEKFSALNRKQDLVSVEKFLDDKNELLALNDYANSLSDVIRYIRDQQDEIKLSDQYTTAEKRLKIKELEKEEKSYYDMFMKQYKTVKH